MDSPLVCVAGMDIGGTKVVAGVVDPDGQVIARVVSQTPDRSKSPAVVEDTIVVCVQELASSYEIEAVGDRLGVPVLVDNDANTTTWAELRFGAGRGHQQMLCIRLGTAAVQMR